MKSPKTPPTILNTLVDSLQRSPGQVTGQLAKQAGLCVQTVRTLLIRKPERFACQKDVVVRGPGKRTVLRWYVA